MTVKSIASALPYGKNTGWGNAGRRISEELKKLGLVFDLNGTKYTTEDLPIDFDMPLLQSVRGVDMLPSYPQLRGKRNVGYSFHEESFLLYKYAPNIARYWDSIVCGSTWAVEKMERACKGRQIPVSLAIQGVDTDIFKPEDKRDENWFTIFSGGKWEYRKSQDVVIRAVAVMMERHKDVRLLASWWNPWPASFVTMRQSKLIQFDNMFSDLDMAMKRTTHINGIPNDRVEFFGQVNHEDMPGILNRCDVAVFPNRCEAGTNLVMMEAMACDVPVIATTLHGHADMTGGMFAYVESKPFIVKRTNGVDSIAVAEYYEPDLDSVIEELERAYQIWSGSGQFFPNRDFIQQFTWKDCAANLLEACK